MSNDTTQMAPDPRGIIGPNRRRSPDLPPGQRAVTEFPIVSTQSPPLLATARWTFTLTTQTGLQRRWDWPSFGALPTEKFVADLHSAHGWSKLGSEWEGVPLRSILDGVRTTAEYAHVTTYTDYTTTVPLEDLLEMPTWIAHRYEGRPLATAHGGPARLLIPHLYLFKSAKWVRGIALTDSPDTGEHGAHDPGADHHDVHHRYGDPWREQRLESRSRPDSPPVVSDLVRTPCSQHRSATPSTENPTKGPFS